MHKHLRLMASLLLMSPFMAAACDTGEAINSIDVINYQSHQSLDGEHPFLHALNNSGLWDFFWNTDTSYTLFVPNPQLLEDEGVASFNADAARGFILHHVVQGKISREMLIAEVPLQSVHATPQFFTSAAQSSTLGTDGDGWTVRLNDLAIVDHDPLVSSNGYIHALDAILPHEALQ